MPNITTSIPLELYNKAKEKHLKWNECVIRGILEILNEPVVTGSGEVHETPQQIISQKHKQVEALREELWKTQEKLNAINAAKQ